MTEEDRLRALSVLPKELREAYAKSERSIMKEEEKKLIKLIPELIETIEAKLKENGVRDIYVGTAISLMQHALRELG